MSSIELEAGLIDKAVEERNAIISKAEVRAERILENARQEEERINSDVDRHLRTIVGSELRAVHDRIVGRANLDGRKMIMEAKMELLDTVFEYAQEKLEAMAKKGGADYQEIVKKLISEAAEAIGEDELIVSSNKADNGFLKKTISELSKELGVSLRLDDKPIETMGGVIVKNQRSTKVYYNTLEGRLSKVRGSKASEVAEKLGVI
ncbi:MAG TPA: V-type ATP synthase subunit E family protein [Candidatus Krumholzibacteriaceae bacterium]|nr:V-type ATP synthase subunit E family protein [Candidatus Krumholzibacteriaceae bacterium]